MAKSKKSKTSKEDAQEAKDIARLKAEVGTGGEIADLLGIKDGYLGRVDEALPTFAADPNATNRGELLARLRAESFIGGYNSDDQAHGLDLLKTAADTAGTRTAETADVIRRRKEAADAAGTVPSELTGIKDLLRDEYDRSRDVDPDVQAALERSKAGLGGLTSEENQALLELQTGDANRAFSGATRQLAGSGLSSGTGVNPAMMRDLIRDYGTQQLQARNDIVVKNADIQDRRLASYSDLARLIDETKFGRAQTTLGNYGDYSTNLNDLVYRRNQDALGLLESSVSGAEADEFNRGQAARTGYTSAVEANTVNNRNDRLGRLQNYQDELFRTYEDNFNRVTTNINTNAAEIASRTGVVLGVPQYLESVRTSRKANEINEKAVSAAGGAGGGGGGGEGGGSNSGGGDTFDTPTTRQSRGVTNAI